MNKIEVRAPFAYDSDAVSYSSGLECKDVSLTVQADAEDADINTIVRRFGLTGELPQGVAIPMSGDFSHASDYHTSMNAVLAAKEAFMQFPADVRRRFNDDPGNLIAFAEDPANYDEAVKLGLAVARPASTVVSEPAASSPVQAGG